MGSGPEIGALAIMTKAKLGQNDVLSRHLLHPTRNMTLGCLATCVRSSGLDASRGNPEVGAQLQRCSRLIGLWKFP